MDINFNTSDLEFPHEQRELIKRVLRIDNEPDLILAMGRLAKSALFEYVNMLNSGGMPNRADEARQDRLLYMIEHYYDNEFPSESLICAIFQIPPSQSKTLLKNTLSRFRNKLELSLRAKLRSVIHSARLDNEKYYMVIDSEIIKDELNMLVAQLEPTFKTIKKRRDSASEYEMDEDTHDLLMRNFQ